MSTPSDVGDIAFSTNWGARVFCSESLQKWGGCVRAGESKDVKIEAVLTYETQPNKCTRFLTPFLKQSSSAGKDDSCFTLPGGNNLVTSVFLAMEFT
jgi:hypothetical protein